MPPTVKREVGLGDRFGMWTVLKEIPTNTKHRRVLCRCDCGTERDVVLQNLFNGKSASCGCTGKGATAAAKRLYKTRYKPQKRGG